MNELPTLVQTAISSAIVAVITWLASRRLYKANIAQTDASALDTMTDVAGKLAQQLRAVEAEVPGWKKQIADAIADAEIAKREAKDAAAIKARAKIIVEALEGLHYISDPDEPPTKFEKRLKDAKTAAKEIAAVMLEQDERGLKGSEA